MPWNQRIFEDACRRFRDLFSDFQTFEHPGERYLKEERAPKDELVGLYDEYVRPKLKTSVPGFYDAYVAILKRELGGANNVAGMGMYHWTTLKNLDKLSAEESAQYGQLLRHVIESNGSPDSITDYGDAASKLWGSRTQLGEQRNLVSLLLMLQYPTTFMYLSANYWNHSSKLLLGEKLIVGGSRMTGQEFERCQSFAQRVLSSLEDSGYRPKDMIDVQSFLYVVSNPSMENWTLVSKPTWNKRAFESSIAVFKKRYQGFADFSSNCGEHYRRSQREFKQEIRRLYRAKLKPLIEGDPVAFLDAYAEVVNAKVQSQRPSGDEGWHVLTNEIPNEHKAEFGSILQSLVNSKAEVASEAEWDSIVREYSERSYRLIEGHKSATDSDHVRQQIRESATLLLSLRWPNKYVHATQAVWNVAAKKFLGIELIEDGDVLTSKLVEDDLWGFTRKINFGLKDAGLAPRDRTDKFDTQSFLWSVYDELESETDHSGESTAIDRPTPMVSQQLDLKTIIQKIRSEGMRIDEATVRQYHFSMRTRGFVILAGPSGVGKTWLTRLYAKALNADYLLAPVAPNWSTNEDLLGFFNPIDGNFHATAFLDFIDRATESWERLGDDAPEFHLVLDEMNLARVEHYFSLFLSLMEMRRETEVPETRLTGDRVVRVPPNLKFAGTVNMDETTHGFADKVFDRAQLIELSISSDIAREHVSERIGDTPAAEVLMDLWDRMAPACPVGFRVLDDIADYLKLAEQENVDWRVALDEQIVSKLLPKLRGLDPEVAEALRLIDTRVDGEFPRASAKCKSMLQRVQATDVVSFF